MKKLVIIILVVALVSLSSVAIVDRNCKVKNARDEAEFRHEYVLHLSEAPEELAGFLLAVGELDKFVEVGAEDYSKAIENAATIFSENEDVHREALERAKEVYAGVHIDRNWKDIRKITENPPVSLPLAETGESISSELADDFWLPPEDFLTEEEKEFRKQIIEAAGLDEDSPDFEEQLTKLYIATNSSEYPNYETYKLFIDSLATIPDNN